MTQFDSGPIPGSTTGNGLAAIVRNMEDALQTMHSGPARPSYVQPGMLWLDTSNATAWVVKFWTGTADAPLFVITPLTGAISVYTKAEADGRYARLDGGNAGPLGGARNKLINANGDVNERAYGSGSNVGAAGTYTIDRWKVVVSGQALTWTTDGAGIRTFTAPAGGVEQVIEAANLQAGTHVLAWDGTASATVNGVAVANGATINVPAPGDVAVRMIGGTFAKVQIEQGSAKTAFERRPPTIEQMLCRRYYQRVQSLFIGGVANSSAYYDLRQITPMRAAPSATGVSQGGIGNGNFYSRSVTSLAADHVVFQGQPIANGEPFSGWRDVWALSAEL